MLKDNYTTVNIRDYLLNNHLEIAGEQMLINLFSGFSCPLNPNVEKFLKENANAQITGKQLLEIAITEVKKLQYRAGGVAVFLESENNPKLRQFYVEENDFKEFGIRKDEETLVQMLKLL